MGGLAWSKALRFGALVAKGRVFGRLPLFMVLNVSNHCTLTCAYCNFPGLKSDEMSAAEIDRLLAEAGAFLAAVTITGGEPCLREDLRAIVSSVKDRTRAFLKIDTSGLGLQRQLSALVKADVIQVSYDGPAPIHDAIRGRGSHRLATAAVATLRKAGKNVVLNAVICEATIDVQDEVLSYARNVGARYACNRVMQNRFTKDNQRLQISEARYLQFLEQLERKATGNLLAIPGAAIREYRRCCGSADDRGAYAVDGTSRYCPPVVFVECNGQMHRCPYAVDECNPPRVQDGFLAGFRSLAPAHCRGCVPNLLAFGQLCRFDARSVYEQWFLGRSLISPFGLGQA